MAGGSIAIGLPVGVNLDPIMVGATEGGFVWISQGDDLIVMPAELSRDFAGIFDEATGATKELNRCAS